VLNETYHRLKRILDWIPILWKDYDWDHACLLRILEFKLRRMAKHHLEDGVTLHREKTAHQLNEAAALCKRMADENYGVSTGDFYDLKKEDALYAADLERLSLLFRKYLRCWWE